MITVTIDGRTIQTEPSKTIIEAAFENGIYVPHFCWHPAMSISGNCRMCLVEVEKMPKQVIACSTLCMDGMVVHVNSDKAVSARNAVMEFILINHPLDCPICDEAGECKLQDYAYRFSAGESRFDEDKVHKRKRVELGPHVMFDAERCISCSRCIRFCEDIVKNPQLTFVQRGDRVTITTFPGKQLDNPYSLNVVDVCPVGALTSRDFRFKSRVWDMSHTPSVCPGCARGCSIDVWVRQNEILRVTPRENQEVNDFWMCDEGRLESWRHVNDATRFRQPRLRRDGELVEIGWDEAIAAVASELKSYTKHQIAVLGSGHDTCEDAFVLSRFAREVLHTPWIDMLPHVASGTQDEFLIRDDKSPNAAGVRLAGLVPADAAHGHAAMLEAIAKGDIKAVIVTDRAAAEVPGLLEALRGAAYVVAVVSNSSELSDRADAVLAASAFAEKGGTFVNFEQQIQILHPAVVTAERERWMGGFSVSRLDAFGSEFDRWGKISRRDARPVWRIAAALARVLGAKWKYDNVDDVFEDFAATVPALKGLTYDSIGAFGLRLSGDAPRHLLPYTYSDVTP
ncbi:MAG: (2Fe-2S)-binding protein [Ignavibacteriae bacterium]|nr:(2Fe-2S)-binding protein [Ignavibacteriota bacterium]